MPSHRVVYRSLLEALYERALKGEVTASLKGRLRPLGLDLDLELPDSLPVESYTQCLYVTVDELSEEILVMAGATEARIRLDLRDVKGTSYEISWKEG